MPDTPVVPPIKLDMDRTKQLALLLTFLTIFSLAILVIDWKIKQSILKAAKEVKENLDRAEKHYWKESTDGAAKLSHYTSGLSAVREPAAASSYGMGRDAGMEENANPEEDTSSTWSREAIAEVSRINRGAGSKPVEVPEGD